MDNITHSLAGLLLAGAAVQVRARRSPATDADPSFATAAALTGVVGANLPDIDVLWSAVLQGIGVYDDLLSLLHHRGFTHTALAALVFIPMLWALALLLRRWQRRDQSTSDAVRGSDRRWLLGVATAAILSHVTLDFTNDYGVHPLSPFDNHWAYGDSVFIIEPWLWVVAIPMLLRTTTSRVWRGLLWAVLLLGLALSWVVPQVSLAAAVVVTTGAACWILLSRRVSPDQAAIPAIAAWLTVTVMFVLGTYTVRTAVRAQVLGEIGAPERSLEGAPPARLVDVMSSPSPANPLCVRVIAVETTRDDYRLTTAWGSAMPGLVSAAWCSQAAHTDTTRGAQNLPMSRTARADSRAVDWQWQWQAPRAALAKLARENCRVNAWLRFVRAPFWLPAAGDSVRVGDLRYDRDRTSVAAFTFAGTPENCPAAVPPWVQPRQGVLGG